MPTTGAKISRFSLGGLDGSSSKTLTPSRIPTPAGSGSSTGGKRNSAEDATDEQTIRTSRTPAAKRPSQNPAPPEQGGTRPLSQHDTSNRPRYPRPANSEHVPTASAHTAVAQPERVRVVVRVRPPTGEEQGGAITIAPDGKGLAVHRGSLTGDSNFTFDQVLREEANQSDVYQAAVQPVVEDVLHGYNGTIMAYGQTGAGKTYTLSSIQPDAIGMMPRAAAEIFNHIAADTTHDYAVSMSYIQIYMELLQDLLKPENELSLREGEAGVFVEGAHEVEVAGMEDCLHLLQLGERNRVFGFTNLNAHSSRSHVIVLMTVVKRRRAVFSCPDSPTRIKVGKLFLVDLAGSERLKKSRSTGLRATEAKSINLSLTSLGMCINARADPTATHVPFRDSKLTRLLQDALGGNAKTSLVIAVANASEHVEETLQSLQFGSRAMYVQTQARINERANFKTVNAILMSQLDTSDRSHQLTASLMAKDEQIEAMEHRMKAERDKNAKILAALQKEQSEQANAQERQLAKTRADLEEEANRRLSLEVRLNQVQEKELTLEQQFREERSQLSSTLRETEEALRREQARVQEAAQEAAQLQATLQQYTAEQDHLQRQLREEMKEAQKKWNSEEAALHRRWEIEREELEQKHRLQLAEAEQRACLAEAAGGQSADEAARLRKWHAEELQQVEERWKARLADTEALADRRLDHERGMGQAALDQVLAQHSAALQRLQSQHDAHVTQLQSDHKRALDQAVCEGQAARDRLRAEAEATRDAALAEHLAVLQQQGAKADAALCNALAEQAAAFQARLDRVGCESRERHAALEGINEQQAKEHIAAMRRLAAAHNEELAAARASREAVQSEAAAELAVVRNKAEVATRAMKAEHAQALENLHAELEQGRAETRTVAAAAAAQAQQHAASTRAAEAAFEAAKARLTDEQQEAVALLQHQLEEDREQHACALAVAESALRAQQDAHAAAKASWEAQLREEQRTAVVQLEAEKDRAAKALRAHEQHAATVLAAVRADFEANRTAADAVFAAAEAASRREFGDTLKNERTAHVAEKAERDDMIRELQTNMSQLQASLTETTAVAEEIERERNGLAEQRAKLHRALATKTGNCEDLQLACDRLTGEKHGLQARLAGMTRSREALLQHWTARRRRSAAARLIQRTFRRWMLRQLVHKGTLERRGLSNALVSEQSRAKEAEAAAVALAREQNKALAMTGQQLMVQSVVAMQDAVGALRAAFLLSQKDLRVLGNAHQKFMHANTNLSPQPSVDLAASLARQFSYSSAGSTPVRDNLPEAMQSLLKPGHVQSPYMSGSLPRFGNGKLSIPAISMPVSAQGRQAGL